MRGFLHTFLVLLIALSGARAACAGSGRVALVIGNSEYKHAPRLPNPKHDAADFAAKLAKLGFAVTERRDLGKAALDRAVRDFAQALGGAEAGLFFYAGHGLQVAGQNYLVPIDAELASASAVDFELVRLDLVQRSMEQGTTTNILIIDACRDNPLARNLARALGTRSAEIGRGFASVESGEGTLIGFSTQPGNVALDGAGRNSPYTAALLKYIATPGDDLTSILINVRNDVMHATARRQVPWEHSALTARFYFIKPRTSAQQIELEFWESAKNSSNPAVMRTYLERYPNGEFAPIARAQIEHLERQASAHAPAQDAATKRSEEEHGATDAKRIEDDRPAGTIGKVAAAPSQATGTQASKVQAAPVIIRSFVNSGPNCSSLPPPIVEIISAPTHGKIEFREERRAVGEFSNDPCVGSIRHARVAYYTPARNPPSSDRTVLRVQFLSETRFVECQISAPDLRVNCTRFVNR
ncbi:MAG: caspase family protein [Hyphomicrobiaceae bacterium]|nr:caspase family protein [Hyphomicrobiaceae bacterium]